MIILFTAWVILAGCGVDQKTSPSANQVAKNQSRYADFGSLFNKYYSDVLEVEEYDLTPDLIAAVIVVDETMEGDPFSSKFFKLIGTLQAQITVAFSRAPYRNRFGYISPLAFVESAFLFPVICRMLRLHKEADQPASRQQLVYEARLLIEKPPVYQFHPKLHDQYTQLHRSCKIAKLSSCMTTVITMCHARFMADLFWGSEWGRRGRVDHFAVIISEVIQYQFMLDQLKSDPTKHLTHKGLLTDNEPLRRMLPVLGAAAEVLLQGHSLKARAQDVIKGIDSIDKEHESFAVAFAELKSLVASI